MQPEMFRDMLHKNLWTDDSCGPSVLNGTEGFLQSQGFPVDYPANIHCEWTILVSPGQGS